jgi:hypothetical protein
VFCSGSKSLVRESTGLSSFSAGHPDLGLYIVLLIVFESLCVARIQFPFCVLVFLSRHMSGPDPIF